MCDSLVDGLEVEGAEEGRVLNLLDRRCCRRVAAGRLAAGAPGRPAPSGWVSGGRGFGWSLALGGTAGPTGPTTWVWRVLDGTGGNQRPQEGLELATTSSSSSRPGDWRTR